jgi:hypothetical protein
MPETGPGTDPGTDGPIPRCTCAEICCACRDALPFGKPPETMTWETCQHTTTPIAVGTAGLTVAEVRDYYNSVIDSLLQNYPDSSGVTVLASVETTFDSSTCTWKYTYPETGFTIEHNVWSDGPSCFWTFPILTRGDGNPNLIAAAPPAGSGTYDFFYSITFSRARPSEGSYSTLCTRCQQFWPATQQFVQVATALDGSGLSISRTLYPIRHKYTKYNSDGSTTKVLMTSPSHRSFTWTTTPIESLDTTGFVADYSLSPFFTGNEPLIYSPHFYSIVLTGSGPPIVSWAHFYLNHSASASPTASNAAGLGPFSPSHLPLEFSMHQRSYQGGYPRGFTPAMDREKTSDPNMVSMATGYGRPPRWHGYNPGVSTSGSPPDWALPSGQSSFFLPNTPGRVITFGPFVYRAWARMAISGQFRDCEIVITPV